MDIHLNEDLARRLRAAAGDAGVDPTIYAHQLLDGLVEDDWAEDRRRIAEYERTGESYPLEVVIAELREAVQRGLRKRTG